MMESRRKVAEFLLQIKAIILQPDEPFTWASGWQSPIYCDNRKTLSYPTIRTYIREQLLDASLKLYGKPDVVVGVATGGIAPGVLLGQELGVGFAYVRANPKSHGMQNLIEGVVEKGQSVIVVEDLVSTGKSSLKAVAALRDAGAVIKGMLAIFTYDFDEANKRFEEEECPLHTLSDYNTLLDVALNTNYVLDSELEALRRWRRDPANWKKQWN